MPCRTVITGSRGTASAKPDEGRSTIGGDRDRSRRIAGALLLASLVACFAAAGCADIHPAPDDEGGGLLESPTHEQNALHEEENRQNR